MVKCDLNITELEKEVKSIRSPSVVNTLNSILKHVIALNEEIKEITEWKEVSEGKISDLIERNKNSSVNRLVMDLYLTRIRPIEEIGWNMIYKDSWEEKFIEILGEEPISKSKLAQRLGFKSRTPLDHVSNAPYTITPRKVLDKLIRNGIVKEEEGYSLTEAGLKYKKFKRGELNILELLI